MKLPYKCPYKKRIAQLELQLQAVRKELRRSTQLLNEMEEACEEPLNDPYATTSQLIRARLLKSYHSVYRIDVDELRETLLHPEKFKEKLQQLEEDINRD